MITTLLKKSSSINYILMAVLTFILFFLYQYSIKITVFSVENWFEKTFIFFLLSSSILLSDFIAKKYNLTKDSGYTVVLCVSLLILFPPILNDLKLLISNILVLIAVRRLISLQNIKNAKEKIFDASLWIFLASIFHFWSILFIILVFISIILDDFRDYRNWLIPVVAWFCIAILFCFFGLLFDENLIEKYLNSNIYNYKINYFTNIYQNLFFSIYLTISISFIVYFIFLLPSKSMVYINAFKKLFGWLILAFVVFFVSNNKTNTCLLYSIFPLSIIISNYLESEKNNWEKEVVFTSIILIGLVGFILQL